MRANPYYFSQHWHELKAQALARAGGLCEVLGCGWPAKVVDHVETRPPTPEPCELDRLDNLRCLCRSHDAQVKERRRGDGASRKSQLHARGCDASGRPLDPVHQWRRG